MVRPSARKPTVLGDVHLIGMRASEEPAGGAARFFTAYHRNIIDAMRNFLQPNPAAHAARVQVVQLMNASGFPERSFRVSLGHWLPFHRWSPWYGLVVCASFAVTGPKYNKEVI